jgi:PAS domain-containing protein
MMAASMEPTTVIDSGQYVSVNQPYAELYGFTSPEELTGKWWVNRLAEDERERRRLRREHNGYDGPHDGN